MTVDRFEARISGKYFSTVAIMSDGSEQPDEIRDAHIVAAFKTPDRVLWLLEDVDRYIRISTQGKQTSGAFVIGDKAPMEQDFMRKAQEAGAKVQWGVSK